MLDIFREISSSKTVDMTEKFLRVNLRFLDK